ncbi:G patch domain-containing protein 1 [Histomonas meleagridis]|uniref:G patch domain-containing protein 1 n=1 Tax=Histomonas meleagridis TaxID=135588 RepID=UPI00355A71F8|nr:G patch domain-containing protein 1 [Histomonas meleagridis]KAH0797516.1 G patch domain-containing protein 1 [Histomonas meleagridis]
MLGRRRRKVNPSQAPRDQFGRKVFHGAFTGGFSAGNFNTVADSEGFVSQPFFSSRDRKTVVPKKTMEDFMDAEDFDSMGKSQIKVAEVKKFRDSSGQLLSFSEQEVQLLEHFGFGVADLYGNQPFPFFSHQALQNDQEVDSNDWIDVPSPQYPPKNIQPVPTTFDSNKIINLPQLQSFISITPSAQDDDTFSIQSMFHLEGEGEEAKERYGGPEKRTRVPWEPAKLLRQRFSVNVHGVAAITDPKHHRRRRDD